MTHYTDEDTPMLFYERCQRMDNLVMGVDDFIKPIGTGLGELFLEVC